MRKARDPRLLLRCGFERLGPRAAPTRARLADGARASVSVRTRQAVRACGQLRRTLFRTAAQETCTRFTSNVHFRSSATEAPFTAVDLLPHAPRTKLTTSATSASESRQSNAGIVN
jgi:hypothetical protein